MRRVFSKNTAVAADDTPAVPLVDVDDHIADYADGVHWVRTMLESRLGALDPSTPNAIAGPIFDAVTGAHDRAKGDLHVLSSDSMRVGAHDALAATWSVLRSAALYQSEGEMAFVPLVSDLYRRLDEAVAMEKLRY